MPSKTEKQRKMFGAALTCKDDPSKCKKGTASAKVSKEMSKSDIEDFARKPKKKKKCCESNIDYVLECLSEDV